MKYTKILKIPYFRGIFMRDTLPNKIRKRESGIVNLDTNDGDGTHWIAYIKKNKEIVYFDSYGNLRPPDEMRKYFLSDGSLNKIKYNYDSVQNYDSYVCGHLCLLFLYNQCK